MNRLGGSLSVSHLKNVDSVEKVIMAHLKSKIYIGEICFRWSSFAILNHEYNDCADVDEEYDIVGNNFNDDSVDRALSQRREGFIFSELLRRKDSKMDVQLRRKAFENGKTPRHKESDQL